MNLSEEPRKYTPPFRIHGPTGEVTDDIDIDLDTAAIVNNPEVETHAPDDSDNAAYARLCP